MECPRPVAGGSGPSLSGCPHPLQPASSTLKIDGAHPVHASPAPEAHLHTQPIYDRAARGLLNRSHAASCKPVHGDLGARLLTLAACLVDMPSTEYVQADVPEERAKLSRGNAAELGSLLADSLIGELHVFDVHDADGDLHPALHATRGNGVTVDRRTVVYYTPDGVAKAIEPKGVKEALSSLQRDQWVIV